ncbi:uncharacterized protein LOC132885827 [Neoarius graeffei]|uniref:uncharacterized protein LOC132885827 n=1 Tax=Neoarius graeffei TaxID=443677 RepID=UPI00298D335F|nr:uncharacterized protein LOC132885827 [Neoarius graeffei]
MTPQQPATRGHTITDFDTRVLLSLSSPLVWKQNLATQLFVCTWTWSSVVGCLRVHCSTVIITGKHVGLIGRKHRQSSSGGYSKLLCRDDSDSKPHRATTGQLDKELRDTFGDRTLTKDEEDFLKTLSPGHILAFATGSSKVPAIGFHPSPKLIFIHDDNKHLPIAHTCANELLLFVNTKTMADDDEFNYYFLVALMNGSVFSTI